jgi:hypothetical protein
MTPDLTLNLGIRYDLDGSYTALNPWIRADKGLNTVRLDADNFAPRAGLVWTPFDNDRRTRLRAGAGVYYDENHENVARVILFNSVLVDRSIVLDATLPFSNPFYPDAARLRRELAEALARNSIPDLTGLPPETGNSPELERDLQVPFTIQTSGGVAHDFGRGWTLSADVLVSRGLDQYLIYDANVGRDALGRFFKLNPLFSRVSRYGNGARFTYRGLLIHLGFAPTAGHVAGVSYTLSKNESNTRTLLDGSGPEQSFSATNPFDYKEDFGPADNDIRHNLSAHWVTTLPYGFQLSGIVTARSALPWSVATEQLDSDPFLDRPEPRNSRRGDGLFTLDARLTKAFRIGGRSMAAFVESFNATNATNLTGYVTRRSGAQFGLPTAALERRRVQLGLRLDF